MSTTIPAPSWQAVLEQTRQYNAARPAGHDLRPLWRAEAFGRYADQPEPIVRARAFEAVLDAVELTGYAGERIVGSRAGFCGPLPADVDEEAYRQALAEHAARGQRDFWAGFDHTLADYPTLLAEGIEGLLARVAESARAHTAPAEWATLEGMRISLEAFSRFIARHEALAGDDPALAEALRHISRHPPRSFAEALQLVWLTHIAFVSEGRAHNALGRLDQWAWPFYEADLAAGRLTREDALELLCHLWARIEELGEVTNICIGGLKPDGTDATNELSYLCLEATARVLSPHTNLSARFHDGSGRRFHRACFECIRTGVGFPAIFNDHVLQAGLEEIGIPPADARDACMVGCIETMLPGRQPAWSDSRFNTPRYLQPALQRLAQEAEPTFDRLLELLSEEIRAALAEHAAGVSRYIARFPVERFPDPFLSALTRDCIGRARDVNDGGALYGRLHGIAIMGLATLADSLSAVRALVFEQRAVELPTLLEALAADFVGHEPLRRQLLERAPKYGNDEPAVDTLAAWVVRMTSDACLEHTLPGGGRFVSAMAANVQNISAGREVGATPDGRRAGEPLSDAASPAFGRDRKGPTAFLQSVAVPDYRRVLTGTVINMKFEPQFFQGDDGAQRFEALTRFFVERRIPQLQFNFTGQETLEQAQAHPEQFGHLVVRVSGFSAYFTRLSREVQADVIRRRAHR